MKRTDFCSGWEFSRDGGEFAPVTVPHDAMLGARRGPDAPAGSASGYHFGCSCRYRKEFDLDETQAAATLMLEFEGVYRDARIRVNGTEVEAPPYGFVPFFIDMTGLVRAGKNIIEVDADNTAQPDCRWYSGAGIYRPVTLWSGGAHCIPPEGIRVTTASIEPPAVRVQVEHADGEAHVAILDDEVVLAECAGDDVEIALDDARLWSPEAPHLYRCVVQLVVDGDIADEAETTFGIRRLSWNSKGLFINGRETLLRGGCIHCDNGILGAASWRESEFRRIRLLKAAGFNAVRIAHNPAPSALLDACDKLGMFVMDEAWDMWFAPKSAHDYARQFLHWCDHDLRQLVSHDYNHPSVIMYSIGNEVSEPVKPTGVGIEESMVDLLHSLDPTRPVTCGINLTLMVMERAGQGWYDTEGGVAEQATASGAPRGSMLFNLVAQASGAGMTHIANLPGADRLVSPALDALDIAGYNYAAARYAIDARKHPERIIVGSETFPHELARNWEKVEKIPSLIGDFMWAAWDYLGEAGAGAWAYTPEEAGFSKPWPWLLAGSGALDIFGQPNAHAALAGAVWDTLGKPSIQVRPVNRMKGRTFKATWRGSDAIPCWSWDGCEGTVAEVEVYDSRADVIRLLLNDSVVGQERVREFVARFSVEYQPGTLVALALDRHGHELARAKLSSARGPVHLAFSAEMPWPALGGIVYVPVEIVGANGTVEANRDERIEVAVEGGELLAFGSAQPAPTESFLDGAYTTYRGRAMAVVRRTEPGTAILTARGETLAARSCEIEFR